MIVTKPADFRMNQKEFFQKAYEGEPVIISRPRNENVVIISVDEFNRMQFAKRMNAYCEGLADLKQKATEMEEKDNLSEKDLMKFYKSFLQFMKQNKDRLFSPLTEEEMIEELEEARKDAEAGKLYSPDQIREEMRALFGV